MKLSTLGLRGVAANILWGWANYYKKIEDWDKLEMTVNQIIRLQPNFVEVWDFQAHNLSYNVSVEFDDYRMRYQWVKKGIDFLILGTHYNRDEPGLLSQVGWFVGPEDRPGRRAPAVPPAVPRRQGFSPDVSRQRRRGRSGRARARTASPTTGSSASCGTTRPSMRTSRCDKPIRGRTPLLFYSGGADVADQRRRGDEEGRLLLRERGAGLAAGEGRVAAIRRARAADLRGLQHSPERQGAGRSSGSRTSREELARLCPGVEEEIRKEKIGQAIAREAGGAGRAAGAAHRPSSTRWPTRPSSETKVLPRDFLGRRRSREDRPRVRQLVDQIEQDELTTHQIELNRRIVNFAYWRTRAEAELTEEAPKAHSSVVRSRQAGRERREPGQGPRPVRRRVGAVCQDLREVSGTDGQRRGPGPDRIGRALSRCAGPAR